MDVKKFLATKGTGWYFSAVACVLAIITLLVYTIRGGNSYSPVSGAAVATLAIGIVLNLGVLYKDFKVGAFLPFILYVVTLGILLNSEMLFVSNVFTGIDNNVLDVAFIVFILTLVLTIVAAFGAYVAKMTKED